MNQKKKINRKRVIKNSESKSRGNIDISLSTSFDLSKFKIGDLVEIYWHDSYGESRWMSKSELESSSENLEPLRTRADFISSYGKYLIVGSTLDPNSMQYSLTSQILLCCIKDVKLLKGMGDA